MRKGTTLFLLAALTLSALVCLADLTPAFAALEATDSGAPSAIAIFPVGAKPDSQASAMPPVAFNHVVHEKWMAKTGKNCIVCHHTGDPVACTECHTVQGSEKGGDITLYQAMHTVKITKKSEYPPSSCVSCHESQLKQRECAGCHTRLVKNPRENKSWCSVCHTFTPNMTKENMQAGISGTLSPVVNEDLATDTAEARKQVKYWSPMLAPYKVNIDSIKGKYAPCLFNHRHHVQSLMDRIQDNQLAGAFHTESATLCITCHHNSPASTTPPKCISCHSIKINKEEPAKPKLKAAFHLQCMNCHTDMKVARPRNTDCVTCHKLNPAQAAAN